MRALSSVVSITAHVGVVAGVLFGSAKAGRSNPVRPPQISIVFARPAATPQTSRSWAPNGPTTPPPDLGRITVPNFTFPSGATKFSPLFSPSFSASLGATPAAGWVAIGSESGPEVLTGPLPVYPELLRQAGVQGRVVLEAIVDTTGRVNRDSILVVSATNPDFVVAARQALVATLFRPALVAGRAIRTRVRIPYEFPIRNGTGRAR